MRFQAAWKYVEMRGQQVAHPTAFDKSPAYWDNPQKPWETGIRLWKSAYFCIAMTVENQDKRVKFHQ